MKANEAPDKLYYAPYGDIREGCPITDNDIVYTRTDAFVEKAQDFFRQSHHLFGLDGNELYHFIEDFRKYMEGE